MACFRVTQLRPVLAKQRIAFVRPAAATLLSLPSSHTNVRWHSHDGDGHSHDRMLVSADAQLRKSATAVVHASMLTDLSLALLKGVAGAWTGSSALITDAVHSAGDLLLSATVLISTRIAATPPDEGHPYGHGRFDSLGAFAVSGLLVGAGVSIGMRAFESIQDALKPGGHVEPLISVMDQTLLADPTTAAVAIGACLASVGVKEAMYRWSMRIGMASRSQALIANAAHHRSDSLSSGVAAIGICGAMLGVPVLDPLCALGIAAMIGKLGLETGVNAAKELVDEKLDHAVLADVEALAEGHEDILSLRRLRARRMGPSVLVDVEMGVRRDITVAAAAAVADALRREMFAKRPEITEATISTFPADQADGHRVPQHGAGHGHGHSHGEAVSQGTPASAVATEEIRRAVRAVLVGAQGIRGVISCEVSTDRQAAGGSPLPVRVTAKVLVDMGLPVREASAHVRRAQALLLGLQQGEAWRVVDASVQLEIHPV